MWPASDSLLARRYRLDDRIAAGGFGEVWRGSDTVLARPVAIKLLHPHAAHLAGVVHRDIKPGNLLLAPGSQVKITDFGISHSIGSAPVTSTGMLLGTAGYLAPEQVAGRRATSKSDLYSLGVVAHECLAGTPPFAGTQLEVALAHRARLPPETGPRTWLPAGTGPPARLRWGARHCLARPPATCPVRTNLCLGVRREAEGGLAGSPPWLRQRSWLR